MVKPLFVFVGSVLASLAVQVALSGCFGSNPCNCPKTPEFPGEQAALPITHARNYSNTGGIDPPPFNFEGATVEIVGQQVVIRYMADGADNQITYNILPAP